MEHGSIYYNNELDHLIIVKVVMENPESIPACLITCEIGLGDNIKMMHNWVWPKQRLIASTYELIGYL